MMPILYHTIYCVYMDSCIVYILNPEIGKTHSHPNRLMLVLMSTENKHLYYLNMHWSVGKTCSYILSQATGFLWYSD